MVLGEAMIANGEIEAGRRSLEGGVELAERLAVDGNPDAGEWLEMAREALADLD